jgi:hypothetical protein
VHGLEAVFLPHEFSGQPVEQRRVRRAAAVGAEVVGRVHDPHAKMVLPEAVDDDASWLPRSGFVPDDQPAFEA